MVMKKKILLLLFISAASGYGFASDPYSGDPGVSAPDNLDYRKLVSHADLNYNKPVSRSEAGMPVGNGRMGSLVWTRPTSLKMQINRVDVFAMNSSTKSFPVRNTDYASGCAYVDVNMVDYGKDIFAGENFHQHLGLYDGVMTANGKDITARVIAWHERDVMAIEIIDQRKQPVPVNVDLRMLRYLMQFFPGENFNRRKNFELSSKHAVMVQTDGHTATSRLDIRDGRIILTQQFREDDFYNASAVAISIVGRASMARYFNEHTVRLSAAPGLGRFIILIGSASSFDPEQDVASLALKELDAAEVEGFDGLLASNKTWWHEFWSRSFVDLHSEDGVADYVEQNYTYFQYVMASSSRGAYPPRFGGMLWYTTGDMREWGSQYWWHNQSCLYNALPPTNRFELMEPMFSMYSTHFDSYTRAASQQWGSKGVWIPETTWFNGLEELPEDIAAEMRDLYLVRKPWEERSKRFISYFEPKLKHNSRLNWADHSRWENGHWIMPDKGVGSFGHVNHILSSTAKIAYLYWLRYEYTLDKDWLKEYAYPMIKGTVEFYRNFPNLKKASDGKYHINHINNGEPVWDVQDPVKEIAAMRGMTPILIRASEILNTDGEMRPVWREFAENLAALPTSDILSTWHEEAPRYWIRGVPPAGYGNPERPSLAPALFYDLCTAGTENEEMTRLANATFRAIYPQGISEHTTVSTLTQIPIVAAHLGRADDLKHMIPNQMKCLPPDEFFGDWVLPNRMTLTSGPGALTIERTGNASAALNAALLQSVPPAPGKDAVIYLFPALPDEWDASYKLLARGAFLVSTSIKKGNIAYVKIEPLEGGECRLSNPWPGKALDLYRDNIIAEDLSGKVVNFSTKQGEIVTIVPSGSKPPK